MGAFVVRHPPVSLQLKAMTFEALMRCRAQQRFERNPARKNREEEDAAFQRAWLEYERKM